jgi:DNA-directed RNA polymerase specialized sigma subunit
VKHLKAKKYAHINADVRQKGEEMTPKEYLTQTYRIEQRIESLRRELKRIKEDIPIASYENIGGHSSLISSPTEIKADKCIELTELIQGEMDKLILTVMNIHRSISDLSDVDEQLVLRMRYLERGEDGKFQKWESISYRLKTDKRQVLRIHGKALEHLQICH